MSQQQERKILRIGIIQGGKIVEERLLRKREPVTVGEDVKNTFSIPNVGLPRQFPLFLLKGDKYYLTMAAWMDGRLSLGSGVNTLNSLQQRGIAKKVGQVDYAPPGTQKKKVPVFQVPLTDKSRGKLTLGDVTLLFQFVTPPPLPAKTQLPAIMQGGWTHGIAWSYAVILLCSFLAHLSFVYWFYKIGPLPERLQLEQISARFKDVIVPKKKEVPKPKKDKDKAGKDKGKKGKRRKRGRRRRTERRRETKQRRRASAADRAKAKAARRAAARRKIMSAGLMQALIGAKSTDGSGGVDVIAGGGVLDDVSRATKGLKGGLGVATGKVNGARRRGAGGGGALKVGTSVGKGPSGGGAVGGGGARKSRRIRSRLKIRKIEQEDGGTLDAGKLSRLIRRKMSAVQSCYNRELKKDKSLRGKISFRIVVRKSGRVRSVEVEDNELNSAVGSCIKRKVKRWKFPKPKDSDSSTIVIPFLFEN